MNLSLLLDHPSHNDNLFEFRIMEHQELQADMFLLRYHISHPSEKIPLEALKHRISDQLVKDVYSWFHLHDIIPSQSIINSSIYPIWRYMLSVLGEESLTDVKEILGEQRASQNGLLSVVQSGHSHHRLHRIKDYLSKCYSAIKGKPELMEFHIMSIVLVSLLKYLVQPRLWIFTLQWNSTLFSTLTQILHKASSFPTLEDFLLVCANKQMFQTSATWTSFLEECHHREREARKRKAEGVLPEEEARRQIRKCTDDRVIDRIFQLLQRRPEPEAEDNQSDESDESDDPTFVESLDSDSYSVSEYDSD